MRAPPPQMWRSFWAIVVYASRHMTPPTDVYAAARLAREIRRDPARLAAYRYPGRMELATTCCCHICVEDENLRDADVAWCIREAARKEHATCLRLALWLARASVTQRRKIAHLAWYWLPPDMEQWG